MLAPGMRRTAQRTMVYNAIVRLGGHCTADEITVELQKTSARFPRSTVYRSLEVLEELGLIKETRIRDRAYYELAEEGTDHYHLVCDQCGSTLHIEGDHMVPVLHHITDEHGFVVSNADLVVHGRCARCQAKATRTR